MRKGRSALLVCPTGGGKTIIAADIIHSAFSKGSRVVFLAHRKELIDQTSEKLSRFDVPHGIIQAGRLTNPGAHVQVASVQTLIRRPGLLERVDLIFADECHHATTANTYAKLFGWWPNAKILGLTATPWRLDGKGLGDIFERHHVAATPSELKKNGFLVPITGHLFAALDTRSIAIRGGDYSSSDLARVAAKKYIHGKIVDEWIARANGKRTVVYACGIDHSTLIRADFAERGIKAEHLDGNTPQQERDAIVRRVRSGETTVVTNCAVLTEGVDVPELECVILARPTLSTTLYLQMVGRVLRPAEGKAVAVIHDHAGCIQAHGHPFAKRDWDPEKNPNKKRGEKARILRCHACGCVIDEFPCAGCGAERPAAKATAGARDMVPAELEAEAIEIGDSPRRKKKDRFQDPTFRRECWLKRFPPASDPHQTGQARIDFLVSMMKKHGVDRGQSVYHWTSGNIEWPTRTVLESATTEFYRSIRETNRSIREANKKSIVATEAANKDFYDPTKQAQAQYGYIDLLKKDRA